MTTNPSRLGQSLLGAALSIFILGSCNSGTETENNSNDSLATIKADSSMNHETHSTSLARVNHAEATINGTTADTVVNGTARFDADSSGKVKLVIDITAEKKAGSSVAVHLHEHGDCGEKGTMAHGHWNPTKAQHGKWGSDNFHLGDIGNIKLDAKGKGTITLTTDLWTLGGDSTTNVIGRAVIVHSGVDDYKTQPTGNAGSRIGCGVIH